MSAIRFLYRQVDNLSKLLAEQKTENADLRAKLAANDNEIQQICGKALSYPWFKDDQQNFPGTTERDGVCVGEHVGVTIVRELAAKLEFRDYELKKQQEISLGFTRERDAALARVKEVERCEDHRHQGFYQSQMSLAVDQQAYNEAQQTKHFIALHNQINELQMRLAQHVELETALAALPLKLDCELTVGSLDAETDTYPVYMKCGDTHCGSIAEFYSVESAQAYINLLTLRQRMGRT